MVAALFFDQRRRSIERARDLGESAEQHRRIYLAIRARDAERARAAMADHLRSAQANQAAEQGEPARAPRERPEPGRTGRPARRAGRGGRGKA
jgi:GntR family transcriptional repressor for pyruvate dehydrogenase complex